METETQVRSDALRAFCRTHITQNFENWPTGETILAGAFVKFFSLPFLGHVSTLESFSTQTKIELFKTELPGNLLGINVSFEGKRQIQYSGLGRYIHSPIHTVLHEVRELIEVEFRRLGFPTVQTKRDLDKRADDFACAAVIESGVPELQHWIDKTSEIESPWRKFGGFVLISICGLLFCVFSYMGAHYYPDRVKRRIARNRKRNLSTAIDKRAVQQVS